MNNKKTFIERTWIGIKKGLTTPTLPKEILDFQMNPLIRILRVVGGISIISILNPMYKLHGIFLYISFLFSLIFFIYHIYISIHRYKHVKYLFKSGKLDVRNSPLDKYSSVLVKIILCGKSFCDYAAPVGLGLGLMLGTDQVLKDSGREAFFTPFLGSGLNKILPKTDLNKWRDAYLEAAKQINDSSNKEKTLSEFIKEIKDLKDINDDDKKDYFNLLTEMRDANKTDLDTAKSKVQELIDNKPIK